VIFKIHGGVDRGTKRREDSFVITEDHYIDYPSRTNISALIPVTILEKLQNTSLLFLRYSLTDWNLRAILHNLWGEQRLNWASCAVQRSASDFDTRLWQKRGVETFDVQLLEFVRGLTGRIDALPAASGK